MFILRHHINGNHGKLETTVFCKETNNNNNNNNNNNSNMFPLEVVWSYYMEERYIEDIN